MDNEDYSLQDLLSIIGEKDSTQSPEPLLEESEVEEFIREFKIHSGIDRIPTHIIYYTYRERFNGEMSKIAFFRAFKKLGFIQKRTGKQRVYLLDESSFDMSREGLILAKFNNGGSKR